MCNPIWVELVFTTDLLDVLHECCKLAVNEVFLLVNDGASRVILTDWQVWIENSFFACVIVLVKPWF